MCLLMESTMGAYFSQLMVVVMQGKGAKDKVVTRIIVSRCEVDLMKIRSEFKKQNGMSLYHTVSVSTLCAIVCVRAFVRACVCLCACGLYMYALEKINDGMKCYKSCIS